MTRADPAAQAELFEALAAPAGVRADVELAPGAWLLRGFAVDEAPALLAAIERVAQAAPWRHMETAGGWRMSVAMTNCGAAGWLSDRSGYRYDAIDPQTGQPWPAMPDEFAALACRCTRTGTSATSAHRSCRCRWACRRRFCGAA